MDKHVMVWGATGGIGSALVRHLSANGWRVTAFGRNFEQLQSFNGYKVRVELQDPQNIKAVVAAISNTVKRYDWFIFAAGDIVLRSFEQMSLKDWQRIQDANLNGLVCALHAGLPLLSENAPIYVIGAVSKRLQLPGMSAYAASKAAVEAFTAVLQQELTRPVVLIRPSAVMTPLWDKVPFKTPPGALNVDAFAKMIMTAYNDQYNQFYLDV